MTHGGPPPDTAPVEATPDQIDAAVRPDEHWRRLSPRMLAVHPVQELVRAFPALVGLLVAGNTSGHGSAWSLLGVGLVMVLGTLRWFTTTFRITPDQVQVRRGLLRRRSLAVPRDRVRTVDVTANPMHRVVGLARVVIGTGRSDRKGDSGLMLDALPSAQAARLREDLLHRAARAEAAAAPGNTPAPEYIAAENAHAPVSADATRSARAVSNDVVSNDLETSLAVLDPRWIRYGPFTLSGLLAIGVLLGLGWRIVSEADIDVRRSGPVQQLVAHLEQAGWALAALEVAVGMLVVVAVASTLAYVLAFWNFRLSRHTGGTLHVARGLVTTRATTIEERRLRGVEISEPLLLRAVGGARCIAIATGLRVGRGAERGGSMVLPPAPRSEAERVAGAVLHNGRPVAAALVPHGARARRRRYTRALGGWALVVGVLAVLRWTVGVPDWAWEVALVLTPGAVWLARDRGHSLGHALCDGMLVSRWGSVVRRRCIVSCDGIIGWNLRQSFFQRRLGLATLTATTAAGRQRYAVQDVAIEEGLRTADAATPGLLTAFGRSTADG
ncbi:MAG TPA: PH domain-containing protein [Actinopolymorphaceae bacterium]|nr:PH domain-containing protein [Actinopolymorphaceae bacterium]